MTKQKTDKSTLKEKQMINKFEEYYKDNDERSKQFSMYVHMNFRLILTKMLSEMRRKLDIVPDLESTEGYISLMVTLQVRLFNEMIYSLCETFQSTHIKAKLVIPEMTIKLFNDLLEDKIYLIQEDSEVRFIDQDTFNKYYLENIDQLRKNQYYLPK